MIGYGKISRALFTAVAISLLVGLPGVACAASGMVAQLDDRPLMLPSLPNGLTLEAFVVCIDRRDRIAIRASGNIYALIRGRWVSIAGHNCARTIAPVYITPSGATLPSAEGSYQVTLAAPVLSDDALIRLLVSGLGVRTTLEFSQHTPTLSNGRCDGRKCPSFLMSPDHAVVVEGYEFTKKAYLVVRSFLRASRSVRFTLVPLSFIARQREPGAVCVQNVSIHWDTGRVPTVSNAPAKICK